VLPQPEYPGHYVVRLVGSAGTIGFRNRQLFLSRALEDEYVGLEESGDGVWSVLFSNVLLGKFSERDFRICPNRAPEGDVMVWLSSSTSPYEAERNAS